MILMDIEQIKIHTVFYKTLTVILLSIISCCYTLKSDARGLDKHLNPSHSDKNQELIRLRNEGVAHYESGIAIKKALKSFEQALSINPNSAIENYNLGVAYRKKSKLNKAVVYFKKSIKLDKKFAHPYYSLGLIYRKQNNISGALEMFKMASKIMPAEASSHYHISQIYRELGKTEKILQSIVNTLRLDPYHTGAIYQLYLYHQNNGDKDKAKELFSEFSRLKKAFGKTRKEINADESQLSMPISDRHGTNSAINKVTTFIPKFTVQNIFAKYNISSLDVSDFNRDGYDDIIAGSKKGEILFFENNKKGQFLLAKKYFINDRSEVKNIIAARLKQGGSTEVVLTTDNGIYFSVTKKVGNNKSKKKKAKKGKVLFSILELNKKIEKLVVDKSKVLNLIDVDHDGDLEIVIDNFRRIFINDGDANFSEKQSQTIDSNNELINSFNNDFHGSDFRNRVMVDFVFSNERGERRIVQDEMGGRYKILDKKTLGRIEKLKWSNSADMNNDGWTEIVSLTDGALFIDYNNGNHLFDIKKVGSLNGKINQVNALIADFNNDGFKDIFFATGAANTGIWIKESDYKYNLISEGGIEKLDEPINKELKLLDINNNGLLDIVALSNSGRVYILNNEIKSNNANWVKVNLNGLRSSPDAHYVQVEARYGDFYTKYEAHGSNLHIPLGNAPHAEILRITWPNGFVENKFKIDANNSWAFDESERISGSCPSIYAWDGKHYNYVTDAFISGPMGVPMGNGRYFPVDHDEYVKIPADLIQQDGNIYKLSMVEELKEVTYLDQIRIYAIDRPDNVDIYPNEFLNPPNFPDFYLHTTQNARPPLEVRDHHGNDVLQLVTELDYQYPHQFTKTQYTGFTSPHYVEFVLPASAYKSLNLRLFLTGWFYYFDSTSLVSASQHKDMRMIMPELQAYQNGQWQAIKTIGIPSGKDKTIVVKLGNLVPSETEKLRIVSNVEIYWDRILFDTDPEPKGGYVMTELPLANADIKFHGFSTLVKSSSNFPEPDRFDYHNVSYRSLWNPLSGRYTRYGKVNSLLKSEDSRMVVLGSGDEIVFKFDGSHLDKVKSGWKRDFILYLNGYVKDGDKYTVHAGRVEPMPFAKMESYPYSKKDEIMNPSQDAGYKRYIREFQTRNPITFTRVAID